MARSALHQAIRLLAEEYRSADRLGIEPAELRGRRQEVAYSRREFLKRAGMTGAAVAVAGPAVLSRPANAATAPRIAIVGGGIAGLTAALTLADAGVASTVYEASPDRIGGRMHSDRSGYWSNGQVSEFCGELIDSDHVTIRHLAQRFRLATADLIAAQPNGSTDTNWFLGGYYSTAQADKGFQPIHNTLQSQVKAAGYPTTYAVHTDAGVSFDQMTVYDWIDQYVPGGHGIKKNADGSLAMTFTTPGKKQTVTSDQVILCMSFSVLRTLDYSGAGFDTLKQTAITQLGSGRNAKLQLQFATRYWNTQGPWGLSNGNVYSDLGFQNTWDVTRAQPGTTGILVDYAGGNYAGSFAPSTPYSNAATNGQVTGYAQAWLKQLETVFPGITAQWTGKATLSTPFRDPLLSCSYSYWKPGQYVGFSGYEGVPQGAIHFAGEHCSQDFQGYMEGGASEGMRAAQEVLDAL